MKPFVPVLGLLLILALFAIPAAAFTIDRLDVEIADSGDAGVTADYSLTWVENLVVFMKLVQPEKQLENSIEQYSGKDVTVTSVTSGSASMSIKDFAAVRAVPQGTMYITPSLDFSAMERAVRANRLSRFVSIDASPTVSVITFPDGYSETFADRLVIPSVQHVVS